MAASVTLDCFGGSLSRMVQLRWIGPPSILVVHLEDRRFIPSMWSFLNRIRDALDGSIGTLDDHERDERRPERRSDILGHAEDVYAGSDPCEFRRTVSEIGQRQHDQRENVIRNPNFSRIKSERPLPVANRHSRCHFLNHDQGTVVGTSVHRSG